MTNPFSAIAALGVVPVIAIGDASEAIALADALLEGGLAVAEITFRTPAAAETLAILRDARPELLIGAGTLLDVGSLEAAIDAGARFGLAPGFDPEIVETAEKPAGPRRHSGRHSGRLSGRRAVLVRQAVHSRADLRSRTSAVLDRARR